MNLQADYQVTCICGGYGFPISASAARIIMVGRALREAGVKFQVLHCGPSPIALNEQRVGTYEGIPFRYTSFVRRPKNKIVRMALYVRAFAEIVYHVLKLWPARRSTVIYLYVMDGVLNLLAGGLCQALGLPVVQEFCEWFPSRPEFSRFNRWLYSRRIFTAATGTLVISKAIEDRVKEQCQKIHPELIIHRTGVMVDARRFASVAAVSKPSDSAVPSFVWCGTWMDDALFLIRAFALVRREGYKSRLVIIGECRDRNGPALWECAKEQGLSSDDLLFTGCVDEPTLQKYYATAIALLMPLWKDDPSVTRLPNKMGEYLASGRPVVTSGIGDLTEFLTDGVNAYVGEPGNERAFADKMLEVLKIPERADRIGAAGQQTCFARLDYRSQASGLASLFSRCLAQPSSPFYATRRGPGITISNPVVSVGKSYPGEPFRVLGSKVDLLPVAKAIDHVEHWVNTPNACCRRITVSGFHGLLHADKSQQMHAVLNSADLWVPDGIAPILVAKLSGYPEAERTTGMDLMLEFFRRANAKTYSSFFYGDTEETLTALTERLKREYPGHRIAGAIAPPFRQLTSEEDAEVISRINAAKPDVLWVALGMPKQEVWIYERLNSLNVPVAIGVGAAFGFVAGTVPRCPDWLGRAGFEWAYRITREPKKLWRRVAIDGPHFLIRLGLDATGLRRSESVPPQSEEQEQAMRPAPTCETVRHRAASQGR